MFGFTFGDAWRNGVAEYKRLKPLKLIDEVYVQQWLQTYNRYSFTIEGPFNAGDPKGNLPKEKIQEKLKKIYLVKLICSLYIL